MGRLWSAAAVECDDERSAIAALRRVVGEGDPHLVEAAGEDVLAMAGRAHPAGDDGVAVAVAEGEVFGDEAIAVAAGADPGEGLDTVGRDVIEVALAQHVVDAILGGEAEARLEAQRPQAVGGALAVHRGDDRLGVARRHRRGLGLARGRAPLEHDTAAPEGTFEVGGQPLQVCLCAATVFREEGQGEEECERGGERRKPLDLRVHSGAPFDLDGRTCRNRPARKHRLRGRCV